MKLVLPRRQVAEAEDAFDRSRRRGELGSLAEGHHSSSDDRIAKLVEDEPLDGSEAGTSLGQAAVNAGLDGYGGYILCPNVSVGEQKNSPDESREPSPAGEETGAL